LVEVKRVVERLAATFCLQHSVADLGSNILSKKEKITVGRKGGRASKTKHKSIENVLYF